MNLREIEGKYSALELLYRQIMVKKNIDTMEAGTNAKPQTQNRSARDDIIVIGGLII